VLASSRNAAHRLLGKVPRSAGSSRFASTFPPIADLGVIGDRRTAAVVTSVGEIVWFCPGRFDAPSLLAALLDPDAGGTWRIDLPSSTPARRRYLGSSAVLETVLSHPDGELVITDWMPLAEAGVPRGSICRRLGPAPANLCVLLQPRPNYGRRTPTFRPAGQKVVIDTRFELQTSHPIEIDGEVIRVCVPKGEASWAILLDAAAAGVIADANSMEEWQALTL